MYAGKVLFSSEKLKSLKRRSRRVFGDNGTDIYNINMISHPNPKQSYNYRDLNKFLIRR